MDYFVFLACAAAIGVVSPRLVDAVEVIGDHTGIGRVWLGGVLLAGATSLPELVSTVTAGAIGEPDIAVGTVFGSNLFNMLILGGLLAVRPLVFRDARVDPTLALLPIGLALLALLAIAVHDPSLGRIGAATIALTAGYLIGSYSLYRWEPRGEAARADRSPAVSLRRTAAGFFGATAIVFAASLFIVDASQGVAEDLGISGGVVGVAALALATSLPEVATSLTALQRGAPELVFGNVLGSNVFNVAVLLPADIAFDEGAILGAVSIDQAAVAAFGIGLMGLAMLALRIHRSQHRLRLVGWLMIAGYFLGVAATVALGVDGA